MWALRSARGCGAPWRPGLSTPAELLAACATRAFGTAGNLRRLRLRGAVARAFRRAGPPRLPLRVAERYARAVLAPGGAAAPATAAPGRAPQRLTAEERQRLLARYLPDEREAAQRLRKHSHKWLWRWLCRRDWQRWDTCLEELRARQLPLDEVTYNLVLFGTLLHPRREDETVRLVLGEMAGSRRFHAALLRLQGGFLESYLELKDAGAAPSKPSLLKVAKTFWQISLGFKRRRLRELRHRLADAAFEQRGGGGAGPPPAGAPALDDLDEEMSDAEDGPRVRFPARRPRQLQGVHKGCGAPRRRSHRWRH